VRDAVQLDSPGPVAAWRTDIPRRLATIGEPCAAPPPPVAPRRASQLVCQDLTSRRTASPSTAGRYSAMVYIESNVIRQTMNDMATYDVFLSYARADSTFASHLAEQMQLAFRAKAKRRLRLFFDQRDIATAADWQRRIDASLQRSSVLIAVLSPYYFVSPWCGREWDYFMQLERDRSFHFDARMQRTLIFPVWQDRSVDSRTADAQSRRRIRDAAARQHIDFTRIEPSSDEFRRLCDNLADDVWAELQRLQKIIKANATEGPVKRPLEVDSPEQPIVATRYGRDRGRFLTLLADAVNVTIIGITNENLAESLEQALIRKRERKGEQAFWQSMRITFLAEELLPYVNDEISVQVPDLNDALSERRSRAGFGKRAVMSFLLRANKPNRWSLHEYSYMLPFTGVLFGMPDGSRLVQISSGRPGRGLDDHLFWEFEDRVDQYFTETFQQIVKDSHEQNEVILVGSPNDDSSKFYCRGAKFRRSAMIEGANATDWLPAIIVATWRVSNGVALPLLQVNTRLNSTREIGKVSHVSGYINQADYFSEHSRKPGNAMESEYILSPSIAANAVRRELREELRLADTAEPVLFSTLPFYYPDKENLYFYLFSLCVPSTVTFPPIAEMHSWLVPELLRVREHQVICGVQSLLEERELQPQQREAATDIAALNLLLHGHAEVAERLRRWSPEDEGPDDDLRAVVAELVVRTKASKYSAGTQLALSGLAGLQYREFFAAILPLYSQIGVPGAEECLLRLNEDEVTASAIARLAFLYHDEATMMSLPLEL
jgi:hypothetical protein